MHEAEMHSQNCFITLTYADEHLPADYSVNVRVWQLFMKRLRKSLSGKKIRSFACGEYGDENQRPHYHALLFNHSFSDQKLFSTKNNYKLYTSANLSTLWPYGHSTVGALTYKTAAYTARYIMKKIGGDLAKIGDDLSTDYYMRVHPLTGKLVKVQPEFATQSRRPGIGSSWYDQFSSDAFPSDFLIVDGRKAPVPKFYTLKLKEAELEQIKRRRKAQSRKTKADQTPARLATRELVQQSRLNQLKRPI